METILYKITFQDGREFRVFCANRKQKERLHKTGDKVRELGGSVAIISSGIHNVKQWEEILSTFKE